MLSIFLAACGGKDTDKSSGTKDEGEKTTKTESAQEIKVLDSSEIPTMDTVLAEGSTSFTYINNVGEGLYRLCAVYTSLSQHLSTCCFVHPQ